MNLTACSASRTGLKTRVGFNPWRDGEPTNPACRVVVSGPFTDMSDILDGIDQRLELTILLEETLRR